MKKNRIKHSKLLNLKKQIVLEFFALMLGVILAFLPATTSMAFTLYINDGNLNGLSAFNSMILNPGEDTITWDMNNTNLTFGKLRVIYKNTDGNTSKTYESEDIYPGSLSDDKFVYTIEDSNIEGFHHWIVDVATNEGNDEYPVVSFTLNPVLNSEGQKVTVTADPEGAGNPTSQVDLLFRTDQDSHYFDLTANPNPDYDFVKWEILTQNVSLEDNNGNDMTFEENALFKYLGGGGEIRIKAIYQEKSDSSNNNNNDDDSDDSGDSVSSSNGSNSHDDHDSHHSGSSSSSSKAHHHHSSNDSANNSDSSTPEDEPTVDYLDELRTKLATAIALGGEQTVTWDKGTALPYDIIKTLQDNPNITLVFSYTYQNVDYTVTLPGNKVRAYTTIPWYGPIYLYIFYGDRDEIRRVSSR